MLLSGIFLFENRPLHSRHVRCEIFSKPTWHRRMRVLKYSNHCQLTPHRAKTIANVQCKKFTKSSTDYHQCLSLNTLYLLECSNNTITSGHSLKLGATCTTDLRLHFLSERVIINGTVSMIEQLWPTSGSPPIDIFQCNLEGLRQSNAMSLFIGNWCARPTDYWGWSGHPVRHRPVSFPNEHFVTLVLLSWDQNNFWVPLQGTSMVKMTSSAGSCWCMT